MDDRNDAPPITQAMIDAYDEYTHLTLDRRGFMDKLTKLAGSGAAAAAIAPMLAASSARAAIVPADDARLKTENITWPGDGGEMKGYLVRPADLAGKVGTVIVIHENRGLNEHIKDVARRHGKGRIVSCLEGGYVMGSLSRSVEAHIRVLADV